MRFSPNLTMLFTEVPFIERFGMARTNGFDAVEFQLPYAHEASELKHATAAANLSVALFNLPAGDWANGERGIAVLPDRREEFRNGVAQAIEYAQALGCTKLNCLSGKRPEGVTAAEAWQVLLENVRYAAPALEQYGITLLVEPCNSYDIPGFFLDDIGAAMKLIHEAECSNLRLQFDFYHVQRMQGELLNTFQRCSPVISHVQIADNPGRHEPNTGEIHYENVLRAVEQSGYNGYVGLEYIPSTTTTGSFGWMGQMDIPTVKEVEL